MVFVKKVACFASLVLTALPIYAQVPCSQILQYAQVRYSDGSVMDIVEQLSSCIKTTGSVGFTKEEEIRAQKLITLSQIFSDNVPEAEESMRTLLDIDPEHQLDPLLDPKEIFYLYNKFRTKPIYRIRVTVGYNRTEINSIESFGVENLLKDTEDREGGSTFIGKIEIEKAILDRIEIAVGLQGTTRSFNLRNPVYNYSEYELTENQLWAEAPLTCRFLFSIHKKAQPYIFGGWQPGFLLSSQISGSRQGGTVVNISDQDLIATEQRNRFNHQAFGGLGIRFRSRNRRGFFFTEVLYQRYLANIVNADQRYLASQDLPFRLGYVDDDFNLQGLQFNTGLIFSVYKPKKLKKYRKYEYNE